MIYYKIPYLVITGNDTFEDGDHIVFYEDGTVGCKEAFGFLSADEAPQALKDVVITVDESGIKRRQTVLEKELMALKKVEVLYNNTIKIDLHEVKHCEHL